MAKRRIIFVSVVFLLIAVRNVQALPQARSMSRTGISQSSEGSQFDKKVAENINIRWRSIEYEKTLYNLAFTSNKQGQPKSENLSLSIEIEMPDSGLILSTCPDAVIEQITDSSGGNIETVLSSSRSRFMYGPNRRFMQIGPPSGPERHTLRVGLDAGLLEQINGEIALKGYFYALVAESLEYVELPFKPSDKWVRLTPEVEVRLREARNEASMYQFHIEQRPEIVPYLADVKIGDYLPSRLIVVRQTIVQKGAVGVGGEGSGRGTGVGEKGSGIGKAEKIRYTIAVNPAHLKIPFEFEQIPLSALAGPASSQAPSPNRTEFTPGRRMPEQVKPQFNEKVAKYFEVDWSSVTYNKTLYNQGTSAKSKDQSVSEKLLVRCQARILDPELVVGTCDIPIIERVADGKGLDTDINMEEPRSNRMSYRSLRYQPSLVPTPPSMLIQWEMRARLALGLPLLARHRPKRGTELQPVRLSIELDPGLLRQEQGEIGLIKGYFHALTAESLRHVKVPFKSSDKWVRLTPEVEIQVPKVWQTGSRSRYEIKKRGQTGRRTFRLLVGDRLPGEIVVDRQFIGADGRQPRISGGRPLPGNISGSGGIGGRKVEKIDFRIAVRPTHQKIPFEIEHIPLPEP